MRTAVEEARPRTPKQFVVKAIRNMVAKKLDTALKKLKKLKFVPAKERETFEEGRERTQNLACAQARFNAINEIHRMLNKVQ